VKVVSVVPGNPVGLVILFGPDGAPVGIVDGPTLTAIRTGAVCGLATRLLSPESATVMTMLGAGAMAPDQVAAVRAVRPVERVMVWSRDLHRARELADRIGGAAVEDPDTAVAGSDIVSCATPSTEPLFRGSAVTGATHVNAVGAFTPEMVELPPELLQDAFVVVDDYEAAAAEAGDLIQCGRAPDADLNEVLTGARHPSPGLPTVFKSVGVAAQDVAAAQRALANAGGMGLGVRL
jgi:ornithine cyclodeaminase